MCFLFTDSISQYNDACPYDLQTHPGKMGLESQQSKTNDYSCCSPCWPSMLDSVPETLWTTLIHSVNGKHLLQFFLLILYFDPRNISQNLVHMGPMYLGKPQLEQCIHTHVPMLPDKTSGYPPNDSVGCQQFIMETVFLSNLSFSVLVSLRINS